MRPIDADALLQKIEEWDRQLRSSTHYTDRIALDVLCGVVDEIEDLDTIDYAPVVHGEWIEDDTLFTRQRKCSLCGHCDNPKTAIRGHFCWYCGAKMDGGETL